MSFTSIEFLVFLGMAVLAYWVMPRRFRPAGLLAISLAFYAIYNAALALFLLGFSAVVYAAGRILEKRRGRAALTCAVLLLLAPLLLCKYLSFGLSLIGRVAKRFSELLESGRFSLVQPLGISYFTFKSLAYVIDVCRGKRKAERSFVRLAAFVTFFPEILIGPIDRAETLLPQIERAQRPEWAQIKKGALVFLGGCAEKLIVANRLGLVVDSVWKYIHTSSGVVIALGVACYALQIYFDFAGCTYMALGVGRMLGFTLPENFRRPYLALSVADFWRRWHISLTSWLREYIYIPLGGNRRGALRKHLNVMVVFLVSGIWHGASLTFVVWGALNGLLQLAGGLTAGARKKLYAALRIDETGLVCLWWKRLCTFVLMSGCWIFFRATSLSNALNIWSNLLWEWNPWVLTDGTLLGYGLNAMGWLVLVVSLLAMFAVDLAHERGFSFSDWFLRQTRLTQFVGLYVIAFAIVFLGVYGAGLSAAGFIYVDF